VSPGKSSAGGCAGFALNPGSTPAEGIQGSAVGSSGSVSLMHKTARRASSAKRAVPGEMSVTGFEDTALSRHIDPTLC
jgi:hypothetical protein